jgi:hypothetical protein
MPPTEISGKYSTGELPKSTLVATKVTINLSGFRNGKSGMEFGVGEEGIAQTPVLVRAAMGNIGRRWTGEMARQIMGWFTAGNLSFRRVETTCYVRETR